MKLEKFLEKTAAYYLTMKNREGFTDANDYLKGCFTNYYMTEHEEELAKVVFDYISEKYLEENILGKMEEYVNHNKVDTSKLEALIAIMEELI